MSICNGFKLFVLTLTLLVVGCSYSEEEPYQKPVGEIFVPPNITEGWEVVAQNVPNFNEVQFVGSCVYGLSGEVLWKSIDSGRTWESIVEANVGDFYFLDENLGYVARDFVGFKDGDTVDWGYCDIWKTEDGGRNFSISPLINTAAEVKGIYANDVEVLVCYEYVEAPGPRGFYSYYSFTTDLQDSTLLVNRDARAIASHRMGEVQFALNSINNPTHIFKWSDGIEDSFNFIDKVYSNLNASFLNPDVCFYYSDPGKVYYLDLINNNTILYFNTYHFGRKVPILSLDKDTCLIGSCESQSSYGVSVVTKDSTYSILLKWFYDIEPPKGGPSINYLSLAYDAYVYAFSSDGLIWRKKWK